jgi:hypothetical protein
LVGALFYAAVGAFRCKDCGKIHRSEFPPEDRRKMLLGSVGLIGGAIALLVAVLWLLTLLE